MKISKYCKEECPHYSSKCKQLETKVDIKEGSNAFHSLCWCCRKAGYECNKNKWHSPFGDYPFRPSWKYVKIGGWMIRQCERFERG